MSESSELVAFPCPSCSPDAEVIHEVLSPGGHATVRCESCGHVHKTTIETDTTVEREVVVSQDGESFTAITEIPPDETLAVGEEFVVDAPEAIVGVEITALERVGDERERVDSASAEDVATIWTRAIDNVSVDVTIHPTDGNRDQSRSRTVYVPGDYEFTVGDVESFGDEEFEIEGIQVRDDAGYRRDKFDHEGDTAFAKDIKRVYGRDQTTTAWSAW